MFPLPSPFRREPSHTTPPSPEPHPSPDRDRRSGHASSRRPRPAPRLSPHVRRSLRARGSDLRTAGPRGDRGARGPTHPPHCGPPSRCRPRGPHSWAGSAQGRPGPGTHLTAPGPSRGRLRSESDTYRPRSPRRGSHSRSHSSASFSGPLAPPSGPAPEMSRRRIPDPAWVVGLRVGRNLASRVLRPEVEGGAYCRGRGSAGSCARGEWRSSFGS